MTTSYEIRTIGFVRSSLVNRSDAPRQGNEGAPQAWIELDPSFADALARVAVGQDLVVLTWLHQARRDVLQVRPRSDPNLPLHGVFATRSPDRPNPVGLHRVTVLELGQNRLRVQPLEAIDGTPIVDLKPVLDDVDDD